MKKIGGLFLLLFSLLFFSCGQSKKTEAENTAMLFLQALKEQNLEKMRELYPGIDNIEIFYASDTAFIDKSTLLSDELILVNATSKYLNEEGKVETRHVGILLIPVVSNADDTYKIVDSYGICSWESYPHANFAVHTGCISPEDRLTDQQIGRASCRERVYGLV